MYNVLNSNFQSEFMEYKVYTYQNCVQGSRYIEDTEEFDSRYKNEVYNYSLDGFLQFLDKEEKISQDYCANIEKYIRELRASEKIDQPSFVGYLSKLDFYLYKSMYKSEDIEKKSLSQFESNNFVKINDDPSKK